jgi:hypothetical protein
VLSSFFSVSSFCSFSVRTTAKKLYDMMDDIAYAQRKTENAQERLGKHRREVRSVPPLT